MNRIPVQSGTAFVLQAGRRLTVVDPLGEQVADLVAFARDEPAEARASGRSLDYAARIYLTTGDALYSNRSRPMLRIVADTVGRHDFLLTPCSPDTFAIIYGHHGPHPSCLGNLSAALAPYGIVEDAVPTSFNIFMNVAVSAEGALEVRPPLSRPGDRIEFVAEMDLIVGLTACSAEMSNNYAFKPIDWLIDDGGRR